MDPLIRPGVLLAIALFFAGCAPSPSEMGRGPSRTGQQRRADRGEALFDTVVDQLGHLSSYVDTELRPPVVILDSTKSRDGQDVLATCSMPPDVEEALLNYLFVPKGNSRFRTLRVKPGDIIKYYVLLDEESRKAGIVQEVAMDLKVAQVLNDNGLLVEGGLNQPVLQPAKIEIWRYVDDRLFEIDRQLKRYDRSRAPALGWEPSPDQLVLEQIVEKLNQWLRQSQPHAEWQPDPLLASLPEELSQAKNLRPLIRPEALGKKMFQPYDGRRLQEAVWLRSIANWAHGESLDDLSRAQALFDWTIRNIQLGQGTLQRPGPPNSYRPWQTLLHGHGSAEQRAWVFALLCRQLHLDIVMLSVPSAEEPEGKAQFWLPALLVKDQLYLFDTKLGLPIPGPAGTPVATLAQVLEDDTWLRQLDLEGAPYPVTAEMLEHVSAQVVADEWDLSLRALLIESQLTGDQRMVLSTSAQKLAQRLASASGIRAVRIWEFPFEILRDQLRLPAAERRRAIIELGPFAWRPTLWKARVLHFQGRHERRVDSRYSNLEEIVDDHREAKQLYLSRRVRPSKKKLAQLGTSGKVRFYRSAKENAGYWIGLLSYEKGNFAVAEHWFHDRTLKAIPQDQNRWLEGARYNLARAYEAQGKIKEAIALLEQDNSPQRHGNRLRAKWLAREEEDIESQIIEFSRQITYQKADH